MNKVTAAERIWPLPDWLAAAGISRSRYYVLPPELAPQAFLLGRRRYITEAPVKWLMRVGTPAGPAE